MSNPFLIKLNPNPSADDVISAFTANANIVRVINPSEEVLIESSLRNTILFVKYIEAKVPNMTEEVIVKIVTLRPYYIATIPNPTLAMQRAAIMTDFSTVTMLRSHIEDYDLAMYVVQKLEESNDMEYIQWYKYKLPYEVREAYYLSCALKKNNYVLVEERHKYCVQKFLNWSDEQIFPFIPLIPSTELTIPARLDTSVLQAISKATTNKKHSPH